MPTVTLVPTSLSDPSSNVAAGGFANIDETIASADGNTLDSVANQWTNYAFASNASAYTFGLSDLPAEADTINTVQFRVRGRTTSSQGPDDVVRFYCNVVGTNAPSTLAQFTAGLDTTMTNKGATSGVSSSATPAEVNAWTVQVYQYLFTQIDEIHSGPDGVNLEIDCIEIIVDYNLAPEEPPSEPPAGGSYTVLPTTDTSIYGLCIAQARDFVVIGGLDTDRYAIRWCAIGDPTDWPTPNTDDARSKQSGSQSFPTRFGYVTGIAGDDFSMLVFQEGAIHRATYVGGDIVWNFDAIDENRGCVRQGRITKAGDLVFFQSKFGYHMIKDGKVADIGYGAVDDSYT